MEEVHLRNAAALEAIIQKYGWPTEQLVGQQGAEAAWRILQHAISLPDLQRRGLASLQKAVANGESPPWQAAMLEDRICTLEGRPQIYGTQFDWDAKGVMSPLPMKDPETVNERRCPVGLDTIEERTTQMRRDTNQSQERPPLDHKARQREMEAWVRKVGWRE
jgi:hypothetical protein